MRAVASMKGASIPGFPLLDRVVQALHRLHQSSDSYMGVFSMIIVSYFRPYTVLLSVYEIQGTGIVEKSPSCSPIQIHWAKYEGFPPASAIEIPYRLSVYLHTSHATIG